MSAAIAITNTDYTHHQVRQMALKCKDANHSRRLLAIAGVCAGVASRTSIAHQAGVGLQTLRVLFFRIIQFQFFTLFRQ